MHQSYNMFYPDCIQLSFDQVLIKSNIYIFLNRDWSFSQSTLKIHKWQHNNSYFVSGTYPKLFSRHFFLLWPTVQSHNSKYMFENCSRQDWSVDLLALVTIKWFCSLYVLLITTCQIKPKTSLLFSHSWLLLLVPVSFLLLQLFEVCFLLCKYCNRSV